MKRRNFLGMLGLAPLVGAFSRFFPKPPINDWSHCDVCDPSYSNGHLCEVHNRIVEQTAEELGRRAGEYVWRYRFVYSLPVPSHISFRKISAEESIV